MRRTIDARAVFIVSGFLWMTLAHADPAPLAAFARAPLMSGLALSPDGRYLSWISTLNGVRAALVKDLSAPQSRASIVMSSPADYSWSLSRCRWATDRRLLCGILAPFHDTDQDFVYQVTRLAAVDADGKNLKPLLQNSTALSAEGQLQDTVIDWTPGKPDTVIIEAEKNQLADVVGYSGHVGNATAEYPALFELNVVTGEVKKVLDPHDFMTGYLTDHHGEARLAWGVFGDTTQILYYVRDPGKDKWRPLLKYKVFTKDQVLRPISVCVDHPDCAYAIGSSDDRDALWRMDLTGENPPVIEYAHPSVDVGARVFAHDGRLMAIRYETDRPFTHYVDAKWGEILSGLQKALPDTDVEILDASRDERLFLISASSDVDEGTYYLLDTTTHQLSRIGTSHPDLAPATLGRMQTISYPAQDGTTIPGYLTVPPGVRAEHLPLIVMPHGGPIARDSWEFDFLRAFLVSRGYAVLQMNFRGSWGYGDKWFFDAHQDWGGLTYSDIADGARWALKQGIADPGKVCIVGWSFGGYAALLGATRNPDLFHCAASIAGISDLSLLVDQEQNFVGGRIARAQIGTSSAKLKADSPRNFAANVNMPLLMIHGDNDAQSNVEQSIAMDKALTKAGKAHEFILIKGADHQMSRESDRTTLLSALEKFLATNLH
jgi:dienelactone hydrolase